MEKKHRVSISFLIVCSIIVIGILSKLIMPYSPDDFSFEALLRPSLMHLLGTDEMGRDIFSMLMNGFRSTVYITIISSALSTFIGTICAVVATYYGGWLEKIIRMSSDLFIIIPEILIILVFSVYSKPSVYNTILAISLFSWSKVTRILLIRCKVSLEKEKLQYTMLIKGSFIDILRKLWYEISPAVGTMFILQCSKATVYETSLSFLGLGDSTLKTWGRLIKSALDFEGIFYDKYYLWYLIPPILCIVIFVVALSRLGERVEE